MNTNELKLHSVPASIKVELTLYLIREELKGRKFFNALRNLGLDDSHYQPNLDELIMASLGLDDEQNQTSDFYYKVMEKYSGRIEPDQESINKQAIKAYHELIKTRKRKDGRK